MYSIILENIKAGEFGWFRDKSGFWCINSVCCFSWMGVYLLL